MVVLEPNEMLDSRWLGLQISDPTTPGKRQYGNIGIISDEAAPRFNGGIPFRRLDGS